MPEPLRYAHRIEPGTKVTLADYDPDFTADLDKKSGEDRFKELNAELDVLQEDLFAAGKHAVLMILQGMDTAGKDGAIRGVMEHLDPQGCRVESFKVPTEEELAHDFLWRVHRVVPRRGVFGVFNRSHYEDVLVVRVHNLAPPEVWQRRYDQINEFESLLAATGTIILKFYLHISKEEQEQRLLEREEDVAKAWKLSARDWKERALWDDYIRAYEDAITRCSTAHAPWIVVPANKKWFRNIAISEALVATLRDYQPAWDEAMAEMSRARLAELQELRAGGG